MGSLLQSQNQSPTLSLSPTQSLHQILSPSLILHHSRILSQRRILSLSLTPSLSQTQLPRDYTFGDDCNNLTDQFCGDVDCAECRWSWPAGSDWSDPDAACRCSRKKGDSDDDDSSPDTGYPSLDVEIDGVKETLYIQTPDWSSA